MNKNELIHLVASPTFHEFEHKQMSETKDLVQTNRDGILSEAPYKNIGSIPVNSLVTGNSLGNWELL